MPRTPDHSNHTGPVQPAFTFTAPAHRRAGRDADALGLDCLARTLGLASLNMGVAALGSAEQAARLPSPRQAADAARNVAQHVTQQLEGLELALADVLGPRR